MKWFLLVAALFACACAQHADIARVQPSPLETPWHIAGAVTYLKATPLPPHASVTIRLVDVSSQLQLQYQLQRRHNRSNVIALQTVTDPKMMPVSFDLAVYPGKFTPDGRYELSAMVVTHGRVRFATIRSYVVVPGPKLKPVEVVVDEVSSNR